MANQQIYNAITVDKSDENDKKSEKKFLSDKNWEYNQDENRWKSENWAENNGDDIEKIKKIQDKSVIVQINNPEEEWEMNRTNFKILQTGVCRHFTNHNTTRQTLRFVLDTEGYGVKDGEFISDFDRIKDILKLGKSKISMSIVKCPNYRGLLTAGKAISSQSSDSCRKPKKKNIIIKNRGIKQNQ